MILYNNIWQCETSTFTFPQCWDSRHMNMGSKERRGMNYKFIGGKKASLKWSILLPSTYSTEVWRPKAQEHCTQPKDFNNSVSSLQQNLTKIHVLGVSHPLLSMSSICNVKILFTEQPQQALNYKLSQLLISIQTLMASSFSC